MGGGIAYQSALKGTPIIMKDIVQGGIDLGMSEAQKLANKQLARGKMDSTKMANVIINIKPSLSYEGFDKTDIVVEAVIENSDVKKKVLSELEELVRDDTIIATNTSTISVDELATALKQPENFCGMHFFNPVPVMPLVEVIRGARSSEAAIATAVPGTLQYRQVISRSVKALITPPTRSISRAISAAERVSVPLKTICSKKWLQPYSPGLSSREPWLYQNPSAAVRVFSTDSAISVAPSRRLICWINPSVAHHAWIHHHRNVLDHVRQMLF